VLVWASFLTFNPRLDDAEFSRIERQRLQRDTGLGGLDLVTDQPIVVAARWHGTFGAVNFADWLLGVFAAPAISFADAIVVPPRYSGTDATKRESYVIAVTGFVLSTGFWVSFGDAVTALRSYTDDVRQPSVWNWLNLVSVAAWLSQPPVPSP